MHEKWLELIPLYVAHQLSHDQNMALEQHIANCLECQQELKEWQVIASVVQDEATTWGASLPPLSTKVRAEIQGKKGENNSHTPQPKVTHLTEPTLVSPAEKRRRGRWPLSLVAAAITVILFSSILFYVATSGDSENKPSTVVGLSGNDASQTWLPATQPNDVASPTFTPFGGAAGNPPHPFTPLPTNTFLPPQVTPWATNPAGISGVGGGGDASFSPSATPSTEYCTVSTRSEQSVPIYNWPNQEIVDWLQPGDYRRTWIYSSEGWYQIAGRETNIAGWVDGLNVYLHGNCSNLTLPSPTAGWASATPTQQCNIGTNKDVYIRRYPGTDSDVVGVVRADEQWPTWVYSDNGWYQIGGQGGGIVGWVDGQQVFLVGNCDDLTLPTPTIVIEPSPVTGCSLEPAGNEPIAVRTDPGNQYSTVEFLQPGETRLTSVYSNNGWYQIRRQSSSVVGWVDGQEIKLTGDCDNLVSPSVTPQPSPFSPTPDECLLYAATEGEALNIYAAPSDQSDILISLDGPVQAIARSDNNWYQIQDPSLALIGWVQEDQVSIQGTCNLYIEQRN